MEVRSVWLGYSGRTRMLTTLAFVCYEWREIVHTTPSLWAYINSYDPQRAILECLTRSGQAPLHIFFDNFIVVYAEFKTQILQEVHRWKSVRIYGMTREFLEELEQQSAPLLGNLDVRGELGMYEGIYNLFCGSASRLRHLTLEEISIPWESNLLSGLRTLVINHSETGPSMQQIVHILQSCPDLTVFRLQLPLGLHPGPIPREVLTIELPRLECLNLVVHPLMTEYLLQRMHIPSCKIFDVEQIGATKPIFSAATMHLIPILSSILLAASRVDIYIDSTLHYDAAAKIDEEEDDEGEDEDEEQDEENDGRLLRRIHIRVEDDQDTGGFALETLSWLLANVHTPEFSSPVSLCIDDITSPHASIPIIDWLFSVTTDLIISLNDTSSAKIIVSYLAEPLEVVVDGTTTFRWPLPSVTHLSFEYRHSNLKPKVIMRCVQRRVGRGSFSIQRGEGEGLPARLIKLRLPRSSLAAGVMQIFPGCKEWGGLKQGSEDEEDEEEE
ncbi:hypothetical protein FRB95_012974 [Tulasnella sp. JGI-2019a]|nr:hypothetical protein FRB95_012974 [Tulasnella sp. JGI-2019a]